MNDGLRRWIRGGVVGLLLLAGAAATVALIRSKPEPVRFDRPPPVQQVSVMNIVPQRFAAPVIGHGTVRGKPPLHIVPQVSGRLTQVHPDLAEGKMLRKGELLFEIDPRTYQTKVRQVESDIHQLEIQRARHEDERKSVDSRLDVARRLLGLADANVNRLTGLYRDQAGTTIIELERAQADQLRATDAVIELESKLNLYPHVLAEIDAGLDARRAALDEANQNVERTRIYCPFNARVDAIGAQQSQVVVAFLQIATLTDMDALEISAVIDPRDLQWAEHRAYARMRGEDSGAPPEATVTWAMLGQNASWRGQVTRLERHDEATRTARVVVEIPNVDGAAGGGGPARPALSIGMFCRAELPAEPLDDAIVIPRHAIGDDSTVMVFVPDRPAASDDGHLELRRVPVLRTVGDDVLVAFKGDEERVSLAESSDVAGRPAACELKPNELVIVSAVPRPVPGMRLLRREGVNAGAPSANSGAAPTAVLAFAGSDFRDWGCEKGFSHHLVSDPPVSHRRLSALSTQHSPLPSCR